MDWLRSIALTITSVPFEPTCCLSKVVIPQGRCGSFSNLKRHPPWLQPWRFFMFAVINKLSQYRNWLSMFFVSTPCSQNP